MKAAILISSYQIWAVSLIQEYEIFEEYKAWFLLTLKLSSIYIKETTEVSLCTGHLLFLAVLQFLLSTR